MGTAGFWTSAAALACLPSALLICSSRRSVWTRTPTCSEGYRAARDKTVMNIRSVQGLAEDLPAVAPGPYRLVTFGQSFHWTDEEPVAEIVYDVLEPGGALALIVHTVAGRPRPPDPGVPAIPTTTRSRRWWRSISDLPGAPPAGAPVPEQTHRFEDVLARTRFGVPQQVLCPRHPRSPAR